MKSAILSVAVTAAFFTQGGLAQTATSGSNSTSGAGAAATASPTSNQTTHSVNQPTATATSNQSTNAVSGSASYGNVGNTTSNTMNPTSNANSNASTSSQSTSTNAGNHQQNSSGSIAGGGGGGSASAGGGQGGNVTANIAPSTTIQFNSPPTSRVESASVQDSNSRIQQTLSGTTEQILSGTRTERIEYSGTTTVRNVPSMNAPPLISSNDTCMGSWSAGLAVAGFGASGGNTYTDEHCKRIKMSRELWNKGMKAASLALDCMDRDAREALEITGFVCPQTTRAQQRAGLIPATPSVSAAPAVVTPVVENVAAVVAASASAPASAAPAFMPPPIPVQVMAQAEPASVEPIKAVVATDDSVMVRVLKRPVRPGFEHVNPDDPFINR